MYSQIVRQRSGLGADRNDKQDEENDMQYDFHYFQGGVRKIRETYNGFSTYNKKLNQFYQI